MVVLAPVAPEAAVAPLPSNIGAALMGLDACSVPRVLLGEEPSDWGSGKKVLDTGLGWKVTVRLGLGRSGSRSRGVRSVVDGASVEEEEAPDDAMVGERERERIGQLCPGLAFLFGGKLFVYSSRGRA